MTLQQKQFSEEQIVHFDFAGKSEVRQIQALLAENGLPFEDIDEHLAHFITAKKDEVVIGTVGLEVHGNFALLRSLAVKEKYRGHGIAKVLCERVLRYARDLSITNIYLLTDSAAGFFAKLQFKQIDRDQAPEAIRSTKEFAELCPSTAIFMSSAL
jgi:amino-acid N-acetyltransferase